MKFFYFVLGMLIHLSCLAHVELNIINLSDAKVILVNSHKNISFELGSNKKIKIQLVEYLMLNNNKIKFATNLASCSWLKVMGLLYTSGIIYNISLNERYLGEICATIKNFKEDNFNLNMEIYNNNLIKMKSFNSSIVKRHHNKEINFHLD